MSKQCFNCQQYIVGSDPIQFTAKNFCRSECLDQYIRVNISGYTINELEKTSTYEYKLTSYNTINLNTISYFLSSVYLYSCTDAVKMYLGQEDFLEFIKEKTDKLDFDTQTRQNGMAPYKFSLKNPPFSTEEASVVVHNIVQFIQNKPGAAPMAVSSLASNPLVKTVGYMNKILERCKSSFKSIDSIIPEFTSLEYCEIILYLFYWMVAHIFQELSKDEEDEEKEENEANDGPSALSEAMKVVQGLFKQEAFTPECIDFQELLPEDYYASQVELQNQNIKKNLVEVWENGSNKFNIQLLTGHKTFEQVCFDRLKVVLKDRAVPRVNYDFDFVHSKDGQITRIKDTSMVKDMLKTSGRIFIAKRLSESKESDVVIRYYVGNWECYFVVGLKERDYLLENACKEVKKAFQESKKKAQDSNAQISDFANLKMEENFEAEGGSIEESLSSMKKISQSFYEISDKTPRSFHPKINTKDLQFDYSVEEILNIFGCLSELEQAQKEKEEEAPSIISICINNHLNTTLARALLKNIYPSDFSRQSGDQKGFIFPEDKHYQLKGFEMNHGNQTYETILNVREYDNLYVREETRPVFSNRFGEVEIGPSNLFVDKISKIVYELSSEKND